MRLVGERVREERDVAPVPLVVDGLDLALVLLYVVAGHEAFNQGLVRGLDQDLRALGRLRDVAASVAVHEVVALVFVRGGDDVVLRELDGAKGVVAQPVAVARRERDVARELEVLHELQRVGRVGNVRRAGLDLRGHSLRVCRVLAAHDDGRLVQVVRELEAHLLREREVIPVAVGVRTVLVVGHAYLVARRVLLELLVRLWHVRLDRAADALCLGRGAHLRHVQHVVLRGVVEVLCGDHVVALVLALAHQPDGLAVLQQVVHGPHGVEAVVVDHGVLALARNLALLRRGLLHVLQSVRRKRPGGADGVHVEPTELREVRDGLAVERVLGPVVDHEVGVQGAVGHVALCLVHVNHHGAGRIRLVAHLHVPGGLLHLDAVVDEEVDGLCRRRAVVLLVRAQRDDVVLREEVVVRLAEAVLGVTGTERVGLRALLVLLTHVVRADGVRVYVLDAAAEALELVVEHAVLVLDDEVGVADEAVAQRVHGVGRAVRRLDRERVRAVHHGVLRRVAGGHVVERRLPEARAVVLQLEVVAHGHLHGVDGGVVGDGGAHERLALRERRVDEQVVLVVGVVRGRAGLHLVLLVVAVHLVKRYRVPLRDEAAHGLGLGLGLVRVVAVEVEAGAVGADVHGAGVHVLARDEDVEHVVQRLGRVERLRVGVVVLLELLLAQVGRGVVRVGPVVVGAVPLAAVATDVADARDVVLHEVAPHGAVVVHLGLQLRLALAGEAGGTPVLDGLVRREVAGEFHHGVGGNALVGVHVAVNDGHLVLELSRRKVCLHGCRVLLHALLEGLVVVEVRLLLRHKQRAHGTALRGRAKRADLGVEAVCLGLPCELRKLGVDVLLRGERVVWPEVDLRGRNLRAIHVAREAVRAHVVVQRRADELARADVDAVDSLVELAVLERRHDRRRAVDLLCGKLHVIEEVARLADFLVRGVAVSALRGAILGRDGLPVAQLAAKPLLGVGLLAELALRAAQRKRDLAVLDERLELAYALALDRSDKPELASLDHGDHRRGAAVVRGVRALELRLARGLAGRLRLRGRRRHRRRGGHDLTQTHGEHEASDDCAARLANGNHASSLLDCAHARRTAYVCSASRR